MRSSFPGAENQLLVMAVSCHSGYSGRATRGYADCAAAMADALAGRTSP